MALVSELPIFGVALDAEKKHGVDTHMVIEVILREEIEENVDPASLEEDQVMWWVEFEHEKKIFDDFAMVKHYLLEEAIKTGSGPKVEIEQTLEDYEELCD